MRIKSIFRISILLPMTLSYVYAADPGPVGHWQLAHDAKDSSGQDNHGTNHGIDFSDGTAAKFDGIDDYIEIPDSPSLNPSQSPFSIAAWVYTEDVLDDVLGDIASKFEPVNRNGYTFNIMNYAGCTTGQPNYRNVHFGIDDGIITQPWTDCGRPGDNLMVWALVVYEGHLYAATFETLADQAGHVYRYEGGTKWSDCGSPDSANTVASLAVYNGRLYAGTCRYKPAFGSALPETGNKRPGGKIYRYEGGQSWENCGKLENEETGPSDTVHSLTVFRGKLYASAMFPDGRGLYEYQGGSNWKYLGNPGRRVQALTAYNGNLYATSWDGGQVSRYEADGQWRDLPKIHERHQTYAFAIYQGELYVSEWPKAEIFRLGKDDQWIPQGRLGNEKEAMAMAVYNGKLYVGSLSLGQVYRYEGGTKWDLTGRLDHTPDVIHRRVWSMAVFQGKLFAGTLPSGHVYCYEVGKSVTYDHQLKPGWRHLVAVRDHDHLRLYIDGELAGRSSKFKATDFNISNSEPLKIGAGSHDYFNGSISDVRFYQQALTDAEVLDLYNNTRGFGERKKQ